MRFLVMHKVDAAVEAGKIDPLVIKNMGALIGESMKAGVFENGAGLKPAGGRTRMTFRGNECLVRHGPYAGTNELLAGFALLEVKTREEAMDWARRYAKAVGDVDLELGLVTEPWDLGLAPKPTGPVPLKFLMLHMADAKSEAGTPPTEREQQAMGALIAEMKAAGVLHFGEGVLPSAQGSRFVGTGSKRLVVDGPFAESKELISGFSIINLPTKADALAWARRYGEILSDIEVDVLRLHDAPAV